MKKTFCDICDQPVTEIVGGNEYYLPVHGTPARGFIWLHITATLTTGNKDHKEEVQDVCARCYLKIVGRLQLVAETP